MGRGFLLFTLFLIAAAALGGAFWLFEENKKLKAEVTTLNEKVLTAEKSSKEAADKITKFKSQAETAQNKAAEIEKAVSAAQSAKQDAESEVKTLSEKLKKAETTISEVEAARSTAQKALEKAEATIKTLKENAAKPAAVQ